MSDHSVAEQIVADAETEVVCQYVQIALESEWEDVEYFSDTSFKIRTTWGSFIVSVERE